MAQSEAGDGKPSPVLFFDSKGVRGSLTFTKGVTPHKLLCNNLHMATNLALDDKLIEAARVTGGHKTKKEAVTTALEQYVRRNKQLKIIEAFGTVDFDPAYDYKAERRRKRS